MMFDPYAFGSGALSFALAFLAAGGFTLIFKAVYRWITPHDEGKLDAIRVRAVGQQMALEHIGHDKAGAVGDGLV